MDDASVKGSTPPQHCHHHRHHHHHHHHCFHHHLPVLQCSNHFIHHHHHHFVTHHRRCPSYVSPPQMPHFGAVSNTGHVTQASENHETHQPTSQVLETPERVDAFVEEDDEDPVFMLTDEWLEFFAKSEAKRKLGKKQAKKGKTKLAIAN